MKAKAAFIFAAGLTGALFCGRSVSAAPASPNSPRSVGETRSWHDDATDLTIVSGVVELPSHALWIVPADQRSSGPLRELQLLPPPPVIAAIEGERLGELNERRSLKQASSELYRIFWACRRYAQEHDAVGPASFSDLPEKDLRDNSRKLFAERYVLLPNVPIPERYWEIERQGGKPVPLAIEVRPEIDDGKHWIVYSDGQTHRVEIDAELVQKHHLNIVPRGLSRKAKLARLGETARYRVLARLVANEAGAVPEAGEWTVRDRLSGRELRLSWRPEHPAPGKVSILRDWAKQRVAGWRALNRAGSALALSVWLEQADRLYGGTKEEKPERRPRRTGNQTTLFGVLGGRAAIRETLQLQDLNPGDDARGDAAAMIEIATLKGVEVKAHDYEKMLAGRPGGRVALAELTPPDRFFAWFPRPEALAPFLDSGSDFLFHLSSGFTGRSVRYGLLEGYLARLGMNEPFLRTLLQSGALEEVALFTPDLFFIDGTDITSVARLKDPERLAGLLKLIGLGDLHEITVRTTPEGGEVFWLRRDDLLFLSTRRAELERAVALHAEAGHGSLGRSAEFRYMLTQLPPGDETRGFIYFSDPFLRRLTGPAVKIGQFRRMLARGQMEAASAGALLYRLDHDGRTADFQQLVEQGYAPRIPGAPADFHLDDQLRAVSTRYGSPGRMRPLLELDIRRATPTEAKAYAAYRRNYERFWRQFFDPIAIRLDQTGPREMALETFILPLIDSSFYNVFRGHIAKAESAVPLETPVIEPEPVALISANLTDKAWVSWLEGLEPLVLETLGFRAPVMDHLGPSLHLALADGDPIINTGSGDLLGSFGAGVNRIDNERFMIPLVISMLTRPASLFIELQDPDEVRRLMERVPTGSILRQSGFIGFQGSLYRLGDRPEWIFTLSLENIVKLRYGLSLQGRYFVVSNLPLSHQPRVIGTRPAPNNGLALTLSPRAAKQLLPALFTAAQEQSRQAAMEGLAMLYPVVSSGAAPFEEAPAAHARLFGFAPLHPAGGRFELTAGRLRSSVFGHAGDERQPPFDPDNRDFGVLRRVDTLGLSLQFEQDGLRVRTAWQYQPRPAAARP